MTDTSPAQAGNRPWQQQTSWRHLWSIAWPIIIANVTFPLVGAADTAMMGRLDDASFVGGVALGSLIFSFIYFGLGFLRMCTTGLVAQAQGRGDLGEIENHLVRGLILAFCLGVIFVVATPVVHIVTGALLTASDAVEALMQRYVGIRILAVPAALANMVLLGCIFGRQQMRLAMVQIIFINLVNLALNLFFVLGLGMTIEGVALASVIAQWVGLAVTLGLVRWQWRNLLAGVEGRIFSRRPTWFDPAAFARFFAIGSDITIRTVLILICEAVLLNKAAGIGDLSLAATQLILVMFGLICFALDGFAHAAEALVGEAVGRRHLPMLNQVVRRTNIMAGCMALVISAIVWIGAPWIVGLLTSQQDLAALTLAHWHWAALLPPLSFLAFQMDGIFIGATRSREMRNAMLVSSGLFGIAILVFGGAGLNGLFAAFTIYLGLRGVTLQMRMGRVRALATPKQMDRL
jgi:MATE family multidrug resistance protein